MKLASLTLLFAAAASAQFFGGGSGSPPSTTRNSLPAASAHTNKIFLVIDCNGPACTAGGGIVRVLMASNGSAWNPAGGGAGEIGSIGEGLATTGDTLHIDTAVVPRMSAQNTFIEKMILQKGVNLLSATAPAAAGDLRYNAGFLEYHDGTNVRPVLPNPFTTRGDILIQGASGPTRLAAGAVGTTLCGNGAANDPFYCTLNASNIANAFDKSIDNNIGAHHVTIGEKAEPTTPAADTANLFLGNDGFLKLKKDSGTVVNLESGGGSGTVNSGLSGCLVRYPSAGTAVSDISTSGQCQMEWDATGKALVLKDTAGNETGRWNANTGGMSVTSSFPMVSGGLNAVSTTGNDSYAVTVSGDVTCPTGQNHLWLVLDADTANTDGATIEVTPNGGSSCGTWPIYKYSDGTAVATNDVRANTPAVLFVDPGANSGNGAAFLINIGNAPAGGSGVPNPSANGLVACTGTNCDGSAARTLTGPAAGISVSNGNGVSGNPTLALANDLAALEGLSGNGFPARTTTDTYVMRSMAGTTNEIQVDNGDGVSGNPTVRLPSVINLAGKSVAIPSSTTLPPTCTVGQMYMDTDTNTGQRFYLCESTDTWVRQSIATALQTDPPDCTNQFARGINASGTAQCGNVGTNDVSNDAITRDKVEAELRAGAFSFILSAPTATETGYLQHLESFPFTITRISCSVKGGGSSTATINLEERAAATPDTTGTEVLTSDLVCDENSANSTTFSNAGIAGQVPLALQIASVANAPTVLRVHVEYTID